ncbi:hypothetical protein PHPALM_29885 [Phytophthora palmivora]|uniref:Uncharacterized protein n=1 Tax=Phytophthora palmivora TaxID=4796 RepID=A0A2P4X6G1_9STRA|nr:hypothetical protein PHPALM_29885 [Phytophthora palmivora]
MPRKRQAFSAGEKLKMLSAWVECGDINAVIATFFPRLDPIAHEQRRKLLYQWRKRLGHIEAACKSALDVAAAYGVPIDRSVGQVDDNRDFESCENCDSILNEA